MSSKIHSTAIIEDGAKIGENCEIGPNVVIENGAVLGSENVLGPGVYIMGSVTMGDRNKLLHGASIGGGPQDINFKRQDTILIIGSDNQIGEHCTLHRGSTSGETRIGNHNYLMGNVHVGHDCLLRDNIIMANDSKLGGFVYIHDRAILSAAAGVHQYTRIGELVMVGALIRVTQDLLPFTMAAKDEAILGLNRIGLKRSGCPTASVNKLKEAYQRFCQKREHLDSFKNWLNEQDSDPFLKKWQEFIEEKSNRGFSRHWGSKPKEK